MHDNTLSLDNREKFAYIAGRYGQLVKFYNVEELCADKLAEIKSLLPAAEESRYTIAMFYRFFIPEIIARDIGKCIYLDSDVIVNLDIGELWKIDIGDKPLAAAPEAEIDDERLQLTVDKGGKYLISENLVAYEDYFNSGVVIMNVNFLRADDGILMSGVKWLAEHPQCACADQDILNYLFSKNYRKLPEKFDVFVDVERKGSTGSQTRAAIYHYAVNALNMQPNDPFNLLWLRHFMKTPWFDEEAIDRLYSGLQQMFVSFKRAMINTSSVMSSKVRGFFAYKQDIDALKGIFMVRKDEQILPADEPDAIEKLIKAMKKSRGKRVFFIMMKEFPYQKLTDAGLEFGLDYVNGMEFLSSEYGVPTETYPLLKDM